MVTLKDILHVQDSKSRDVEFAAKVWVSDNEYYYAADPSKTASIGAVLDPTNTYSGYAASDYGHANDDHIMLLQDKASDTTVFIEVEGEPGQIALLQGNVKFYPAPQKGGPRRYKLVSFRPTTPDDKDAYAPPPPPAPPAGPPMAHTPDWMDGQVALLALGGVVLVVVVAYWLGTREGG